MSDNCCVYCGKFINETELDVDHYLPKNKFPYLSYCWDNLLPLCKQCNQCFKHNFVPASLADKIIVEKIFAEHIPYDLLYNKHELLINISNNDRLIEPSFDNPNEHIEFFPEICLYAPKTAIGKITVLKFFNNKEINEIYLKLSNAIKDYFIKIHNFNDILDTLYKSIINIIGYEYVCLKLYEYWKTEKINGNIQLY